MRLFTLCAIACVTLAIGGASAKDSAAASAEAAPDAGLERRVVYYPPGNAWQQPRPWSGDRYRSWPPRTPYSYLPRRGWPAPGHRSYGPDRSYQPYPYYGTAPGYRSHRPSARYTYRPWQPPPGYDWRRAPDYRWAGGDRARAPAWDGSDRQAARRDWRQQWRW